MPIELLVHTGDPAAERRTADRRASDRRLGPRQVARPPRPRAPPALGQRRTEMRAPAAIPEGQPLPGRARGSAATGAALIAADALAASLRCSCAWFAVGARAVARPPARPARHRARARGRRPLRPRRPRAAPLDARRGPDAAPVRRDGDDRRGGDRRPGARARGARARCGCCSASRSWSAVCSRGRRSAASSRPERCLVVGDAELATHVRRKVHDSRARAEVVATLPLRPRTVGGRLPRPSRAAHARARERHRPGHPRPDVDRQRPDDRADPRREGRRRAREPAAAHVRGRRLERGLRGHRRRDDARPAPLRPLHERALREAGVRRGGRIRWRCSPSRRSR